MEGGCDGGGSTAWTATARWCCSAAGRTARRAWPGRWSGSPRVETVGFAYGQRHAVELACRAPIRAALARALARAGLGRITCSTSPAPLAGLGATALTADVAIAMGADGLPTTFVPGRNLLFLTYAGRTRLSARPAPHRRRHVRDRFQRLPGLPRRHHQGDAARAQPRHGAPVRAGDAADVARQGRDLGAWRTGSASSTSRSS